MGFGSFHFSNPFKPPPFLTGGGYQSAPVIPWASSNNNQIMPIFPSQPNKPVQEPNQMSNKPNPAFAKPTDTSSMKDKVIKHGTHGAVVAGGVFAVSYYMLGLSGESSLITSVVAGGATTAYMLNEAGAF